MINLGQNNGATVEHRSDVSSLLRSTREARDQKLIDVAKILNIQLSYLTAIEDARFDDLPGKPYAIGFIRSYAGYLDLDADEIVRRFKDGAINLDDKVELDFPIPISEGGVPGGAIMFVGLLVAALGYGGWYVTSMGDGMVAAPLVPPVPEQMIASQSPVVATVSEQDEAIKLSPSTATAATTGHTRPFIDESDEKPAPAAPAPVTIASINGRTPVAKNSQTVKVADAQSIIRSPVEIAASETTVPQDSDASQVVSTHGTVTELAAKTMDSAEVSIPASATSDPVKATDATNEIPVQVATLPAPSRASDSIVVPDFNGNRAFGTNNINARIIVRARENSWVQVRDEKSASLLFARLLQSGDTYRVPDRSGLLLLTGNAGAIEIIVDDEALPALGAIGEVRRNVRLDVASLRADARSAN